MFVRDVMTRTPACCTPEATLHAVAQLMLEHDCGAIPVVERSKVIGMVTDRDIVTRAVASGQDPARLAARDVMSKPVYTVGELEDIESAVDLMDYVKVRRLPVVDRNSELAGIVSQADLAVKLPPEKVGRLLHDISAKVDELVSV